MSYDSDADRNIRKDDKGLVKHVARLVRDCESYLDEQQGARERALEYYAGKMLDVPSDEGQSSVVSSDVRATYRKLMPSIMRTIFGTDQAVKYDPAGPGDEESASQATDYVNAVVLDESGAKDAVHDAIFDAMIVKTGVLKWTAYENRKATVTRFTNLSDEQVVGLVGDPDHEIFDHVKEPETDPGVLAMDPNARRHSFKLRRVVDEVEVKLEAIPRGSFLISPMATSIKDSPIVGDKQELPRSTLVSRGYDRAEVASIRCETRKDREDDEERMGDDYSSEDAAVSKAMEVVTVYEVYVQLDLDDDGIAELHRVVFADRETDGNEGGNSSDKHVILEIEPVDEAPYASVVAERDAHQFEGHSVFEDVDEIQKVKTVTLRGTLDSLYASLEPKQYIDISQVVDPEAVMNNRRGEPIFLKRSADARQAVQWRETPFIADKTLPMLAVLDEVLKDRTGVTDASAGLDPEAFQNTSATAANLLAESGVAQVASVIQSIANGGLRDAFRGLLRLVIAHSDKPRTIQLRGKWVEYDPRTWNADMDCRVDIGLGAGSRERDLSVLQVIKGLQTEIIQAFGPQNPYVTPTQLYNTLDKITQAAGLPSSEPFFTEPNDEKVMQQLAQQAQQPGPDEKKLQAQMQLEQQKSQAAIQKEQAQMEADIQTARAKLEADTETRRQQLEADLVKDERRLQFERERLAQERELKLAELEARFAQQAQRTYPQAAE